MLVHGTIGFVQDYRSCGLKLQIHTYVVQRFGKVFDYTWLQPKTRNWWFCEKKIALKVVVLYMHNS
jgi:hypothetical protein